MIFEKVDICTTATLRHEILNETYRSFTENMLTEKNRYRLIINIDPIGDKLKRKNAVLQIARKYFNEVVYNFPETPCFTKAVQWCWSKTTSKYVFHLEDDWRLLETINIDSMIQIMEQYNLTSLRLSKDNLKKTKSSCKYGFVPHPKISLNPTLFDGTFLRKIFPLMDLNHNPEKQLRPTKSELGQIIAPTNHGIYQKDTVRRTVLDIGREWMDSSRYKKKIGFMYWENKDENSTS